MPTFNNKVEITADDIFDYISSVSGKTISDDDVSTDYINELIEKEAQHYINRDEPLDVVDIIAVVSHQVLEFTGLE